MLEYERLSENDLFSAIKRNNTISDDATTFFAHNVISLSKHVDGIVGDDKMMNTGIIRLTETRINPSDST